MKQWSKEECDALEQMVWSQSCDTYLQEIETAHDIIYNGGAYDFPKRTIKSCVSKMYKIMKT
jgi:hypothetical protein